MSGAGEPGTIRILDASVIVCTRNRPEFVRALVESVLSGTEVPAELVVIDQSDVAHPTLSALRHSGGCEIRYHHSAAVGVSRARNDGLRLARHELVVFTDDDMIAPPAWFGSMVRSLTDAGKDHIVTGQVLFLEEDSIQGYAPSLRDDPDPVVYGGNPLRIDVLSTGNMGVWRSALETVGYFDERLGPGTSFPAAEDGDFGLRSIRAGYKILYDPRVVMYHRAWRSESEFRELTRAYGRGQGAFYMKHIMGGSLHALYRLVFDVGRNTVLLPYWLIRSPARASQRSLFAFGVMQGAVGWLFQHGRER
jgi:O-antigen biosynthesis protein